jgi:hypothetical protein
MSEKTGKTVVVCDPPLFEYRARQILELVNELNNKNHHLRSLADKLDGGVNSDDVPMSDGVVPSCFAHALEIIVISLENGINDYQDLNNRISSLI